MPQKGEKPSLGTYLGIMLTSSGEGDVIAAARQVQRFLEAKELK